MRQSEQITELFAALAKAQGEIIPAKKDVENTFFKSKYADLASVQDVLREPLSKNGLSVIQLARNIESGVEVETILAHSSGQFISETLACPLQKKDAQGIGLAITYLRRYGLMAMCGVAAEDDDGNSAAKNAYEKQDTAPTRYNAEKSAERCAAMLAELAVLTARGAVVVWGHKHDAETNLLTDEDGEKIIKAYEAKRAEIEAADAAKQ